MGPTQFAMSKRSKIDVAPEILIHFHINLAISVIFQMSGHLCYLKLSVFKSKYAALKKMSPQYVSVFNVRKLNIFSKQFSRKRIILEDVWVSN